MTDTKCETCDGSGEDWFVDEQGRSVSEFSACNGTGSAPAAKESVTFLAIDDVPYNMRAAKEPGVRPLMLRLGNHMMRDRIAREQYGHETYYLCAEVDAQLAALTSANEKLSAKRDEYLEAALTRGDQLIAANADLAKARELLSRARRWFDDDTAWEVKIRAEIDALLASKAGET